jgi:hypothetical protein
MSDKVFHDVTQKGSLPFKDQNNNLLPAPALNEFSAREIQTFAEDLEKIITFHYFHPLFCLPEHGGYLKLIFKTFSFSSICVNKEKNHF